MFQYDFHYFWYYYYYISLIKLYFNHRSTESYETSDRLSRVHREVEMCVEFMSFASSVIGLSRKTISCALRVDKV